MYDWTADSDKSHPSLIHVDNHKSTCIVFFLIGFMQYSETFLIWTLGTILRCTCTVGVHFMGCPNFKGYYQLPTTLVGWYVGMTQKK